MTPEYKLAIEKNDKANKKFAQAQKAYRSMQINDDEYFEAREDWEEAMAEFDVAFMKEQEHERGCNMYRFTSLTVEFDNSEFQDDLKHLHIDARYIEQSTQGFPEYEYTGTETSLRRLIESWFGNQDELLESIESL